MQTGTRRVVPLVLSLPRFLSNCERKRKGQGLIDSFEGLFTNPDPMPMGGVLSAGLLAAAMLPTQPLDGKPVTPLDRQAMQEIAQNDQKKRLLTGPSLTERTNDEAERLYNQMAAEKYNTMGMPSQPDYQLYQECLKIAENKVMQEDRTLQHQQMLRSMVNGIGDGEMKTRVLGMIENYSSNGADANSEDLKNILGTIQTVTNRAFEYAECGAPLCLDSGWDKLS